MSTQTTSGRGNSFGTLLADRLDPPKTGVLLYYDDPAGFVRDCINWPEGEEPTPYQLRNLNSIVTHNRVCICGPRGLGKTTVHAWLILWFALTRDAAGVDWKCPTTAPVHRQLTEFLWPEVHKWARALKWDTIGRSPLKEGTELLDRNLKLKFGHAFAVASKDPAKIEGVHASHVLFIFDEAKTLASEIFDSAEGSFAGAGKDTKQEAFVVASSTPGEPNGRFFEIQSRAPGFLNWHVISVTYDDVISSGLMSEEWAEQMREAWGEDSAVYQNHVLGKFASTLDETVIPLTWIELAIARWEYLNESGKLHNAPFEAIGVDVAFEGKDKTVLALRYGQAIAELRRFTHAEPMETSGHVVAASQGDKTLRLVVDTIGIGGGVYSRLKETGFNAISFKASKGSSRKDSTGEYEFLNHRAEAWWRMRELLSPESGADIALPPDDKLIQDLTAPKWKTTSAGKIQIESKDDIKKRLGRSPDDGDAVIQAFWEEQNIVWEIL